jgi:predicted aminopeptidase
MKITFKKVLLFFSFILVGAIAFNYKLVGYGLAQAKGQLKIIWQARPIAEVLADPGFPDSLKTSLALVDEIKQFAIDSLGLKPTGNYTTVFDQQGKDILWVVTACEPYQFEPKIWSFPLIGSFTYKGFFDYEKSVDLAKSLKARGYDVDLRPVSGWSTLGWFRDPILSNMLADGPGELANTIIHELTHGTIFIPDSMTFNENLATFIGNRGAQEFLQAKFNSNSSAYRGYKNRRADGQIFTRHIVLGAQKLDSLYRKIANENDSLKNIKKALFIDKIIGNLDSLNFADTTRYKGYFANYRPNNAYFISFLNYRERQEEFNRLLEDSLGNKLSSFIAYWQRQYKK